MQDASVIDTDIRAEIGRKLDAIERDHSVAILLAIESGSRAWGFPSLDSDYDVRFIYVHPPDAYLSVTAPREVIEWGIEGALDIGGWDLRKALGLLVKSNAVLLEWLASPVRYRESAALAGPLLALARETSHLPALAYHYDRLARRSFEEILSVPGRDVRMKAYCYALRPALALLWMRRHRAPPPMDMAALLRETSLNGPLRDAVAQLIEKKAAAGEDGICARCPGLDTLIGDVLSEPVDRFVLPERSSVLAQADSLFRSIVLGTI